jgi:hypothetical protein
MACEALTNIRVEPMDLTWEIEDKWCVTCIADSSGNLENQYFNLYTANDATRYYIWYEVGGSGGVDPAVSGATGAKVSVATDATATAVATATAAVIDALAGFVSTSSGEYVTITCVDVGECTAMSDGAATTGFTFTQEQVGKSVYLGLLDGDIAPAFEVSTLELTVHQTGPAIRSDILQGVSATVPVVLKESGNDLRKDILKNTIGGVHTPGSGTEVFGVGSAKYGQNLIKYAGRLICHPYKLAAGDKSRDLCFWKALPLVSTMTFSGENPATIEMEFQCYEDEDVDSDISLYMIGDWSQTGLVP